MLKKIGAALCIIGLLAMLAIPYYKKNNQVDNEKMQEEIIENVQINLFTFDPNSISRIEIKDEKALILHKQDERWSDIEHEKLNYDNQVIENFIRTVNALETTEVIYNSIDPNKYGIDDTSRIITLYDEANNNYTLRVGSQTLDKMGRYLGTHLDEKLYVVKSEAAASLLQTRDALIEKKIYMPWQVDPQDIKILKKNEPAIHIQKNPKVGYVDHEKWLLEGFFKQSHELDTETTEGIIGQILAFEKDQFVGSKENLEAYGLDDPQLTITINNEWTMAFGAKENEWVYFMTADDPYVYKMLEEKLSVVNHIKPIALIRKQVYIPDLSQLSQITITNPGRTLVLDLKKETTENEAMHLTGVIEGIALDNDKTGELIELIQNGVSIEAVLQNPDIEKRQERKAEITIRYLFETEEAKLIELIPYDNQFYILRLDGMIEFAVGKQPVMNMLNILYETLKTSQQ
ncbi:DUF4340 domain-containing protein [Cellulosilyticum sp. I15G10I2]|uniref:DUF4340 domain-containing protein n=1 Tax=Cellulosilyticum sp. I15G10I2 TaxID=1892843 RepID=UPI00085BFAAE|nr:DUF4340 domain-containing protein [Cellulosilyticum sp. I15G10I2]